MHQNYYALRLLGAGTTMGQHSNNFFFSKKSIFSKKNYFFQISFFFQIQYCGAGARVAGVILRHAASRMTFHGYF